MILQLKKIFIKDKNIKSIFSNMDRSLKHQVEWKLQVVAKHCYSLCNLYTVFKHLKNNAIYSIWKRGHVLVIVVSSGEGEGCQGGDSPVIFYFFYLKEKVEANNTNVSTAW